VYATVARGQLGASHAVCFFAFLFAFAGPAQAREPRAWTLRTGEQFEARFTEVSAQMVSLSRERGKVFKDGIPYKLCSNDPDLKALLVYWNLPDKSEGALGTQVSKHGRGKPVKLPLFFMHYEKADGSTGKVPVGALVPEDISLVTDEVERWWNSQVTAAKDLHHNLLRQP
jgi:hypothetical protein